MLLIHLTPGCHPVLLHHFLHTWTSLSSFFLPNLSGPVLLIRFPASPAQTLAHSTSNSLSLVASHSSYRSFTWSRSLFSLLAEEWPNGNGDIHNVKLLCAYGCPQSNAGFLREDIEMCCDLICHGSCCGGCTAPSETIKAQWHCVGVILKVLDC